MPLGSKGPHYLVQHGYGNLTELYCSTSSSPENLSGRWEKGIHAIQSGLFVSRFNRQRLDNDSGQHFDIQFPGRVPGRGFGKIFLRGPILGLTVSSPNQHS